MADRTGRQGAAILPRMPGDGGRIRDGQVPRVLDTARSHALQPGGVCRGRPSLHPISPAADSDPGIIGGPIESLVVTAAASSAYGTVSPAAGGTVTLAPPSRSGAHPGEGLTPPPLHRWAGAAPGASASAAGGFLAGGGFRLWSSAKLYDPGVTVTHSAAVSGLAAPDTARLHPDELRRLGVAAGDPVLVSNGRADVNLPSSTDPAVPVGVVWLPPRMTCVLVDAAAATEVTVAPGHTHVPTEAADG